MSNVILFPIEFETALIELAAINMDRRTGKSLSRWWQTECRRLHARYSALGVCDDECREIVNRFARAVQNEMERRTYQQQGTTPGGAA